MSSADRLRMVSGMTTRGNEHWSITWDNRGIRRDLYVVNFHPSVPDETVKAVLEVLQRDEHLQRVLK